MHRGHEKAHVLRQLLAYALDARQQLAALVTIDQRNESITHFQADHIDRHHIVPAQLLDFRRALRHRLLLLHGQRLAFRLAHLLLAMPDPVGTTGCQQTQTNEGHVRHTRHQAHGNQNGRRHRECLRRGEHLPIDLSTHVFRGGNTCHHDRRSGRQQQRRDLRHQTVTDGQQGIDLAGIDETHLVLGHTDGDTTDQVDEQNQQACHCITAHKLAGTIHRAIEVSFLGNFRAPRFGLLLIDQAGVEIGIDRHLLAGHGVQGKTCGNFGNTPGALGDHHEVDDHQDGEHHRTHYVVAADHHLTKRLDHLAGRIAAFVTIEQHDTRRGYVEGQAQQRGHQQDGREHREIQRAHGIHADQQDNDGQGNIEGKQHVQQEGWHRQGHHAENSQQQ